MGCKLIVGLGNPGKKFDRTRHNVGFRVVEALLEELKPVRKRKLANAAVVECARADGQVVVAEPVTFMNRSGEAVRDLIADYAPEWPANCLIVSDDVELPLGKLRMRAEGSAGGHRGLESIIAVCGTAGFNRLRVGVGRPLNPDTPLETYVLEKFSKQEEDLMPEILRRAREAVLLWLERGPQAVMNQYN